MTYHEKNFLKKHPGTSDNFFFFTVFPKILQLSLYAVRNGLLNVFGIDAGSAQYWLFLQQPLVEILGTESHPWVLIAVSSSIRRAALPPLGRLRISVRVEPKCQQKVKTITIMKARQITVWWLRLQYEWTHLNPIIQYEEIMVEITVWMHQCTFGSKSLAWRSWYITV